jgi:hypothetical protein
MNRQIEELLQGVSPFDVWPGLARGSELDREVRRLLEEDKWQAGFAMWRQVEGPTWPVQWLSAFDRGSQIHVMETIYHEISTRGQPGTIWSRWQIMPAPRLVRRWMARLRPDVYSSLPEADRIETVDHLDGTGYSLWMRDPELGTRLIELPSGAAASYSQSAQRIRRHLDKLSDVTVAQLRRRVRLERLLSRLTIRGWRTPSWETP